MSNRRDHYEVLGVPRSATADEIKRAYRKLAKEFHPDRNPGDSAAEARFKEVQQAYGVLGDAKKREDYDRFGDVAVGEFHTAPGGQRVYQWGGGSTVSIEDLEDLFSTLGSGGDRPSIFEHFFGESRGGKQGRRASQPRRGPDEEIAVDLSFEQAVRGTTLSLSVRSGRNGRVETLEVKIPPGVDNGQRIRVRGRGRLSERGGEPGDLYVVCRVRPHPYIRRDGADLFLDLPISVPEAVLGGKIEVPLLEETTLVNVPPGTASGTKLRLKHRGLTVPGRSERGNLYVVIQIIPPANLSSEEKELYQRLRSLDRTEPRKGRLP